MSLLLSKLQKAISTLERSLLATDPILKDNSTSIDLKKPYVPVLFNIIK